jgi:hypothetical protein
VLGLVRLQCPRRIFSLSEAKNIVDDVSRASVATFGFHPQGNLNVRLTFRIRVILRVLPQSLQCR